MKFRSLLFTLLMLGAVIPAYSQFSSKAVTDAKRFFPGYSKYEYSHKTQKIQNLRYYYRCTVEAYKNAGLSCYPNAQVNKSFWVEYWSSGELKDKGSWIGSSYVGIPDPDPSRLVASLEQSFDPIVFFSSSWLWDLLEIHGYEIETDMTEKNKPLWVEEDEVWVTGYVTASVLRGCCEVEKIKFTGIFQFKSNDCGKTFTFVDGYEKPSMYSTESLGKEQFSETEGIELQKKTIGRAKAEEKAKEEWDALVDLEMPAFENPHEFAVFAYRTLVTGSEEEVKALLYKTLPSWRFMEGSDYLLDWSAQELVKELMDKVIGNNGLNAQSNFCAVINRYKTTKSSYIFNDKGEDKTLEIRIEEENGTYKIKELKIWLSESIADKECPEPTEFETITDEEFGFSILFPKDYKETRTEKYVIYEAKVNGVKYMAVGNRFGPASSNAARTKQAEDNVHRHVMDIHSLYETYNDWKMNGVTGKEVFFLAENTKYERYRTIYLGDYNYEMWILGMDFTEANEAFFDSFKCDFDGGGARENLSFAKGDAVEIHIGAGRYEKGNITEVLGDDQYKVFVPNQNKTYTAPIDAIREDPNGKKVETSSSEDRPETYNKGDYVLVRTGQTTWEHGKVKEVKEDNKYHVVLYESGDEYIQPWENLKPDPDPTEKKGGGILNRFRR